MESSTGTLILELGDIIKLIAPKNSDIHQQDFLITYVDTNIIKLFDVITFKPTILNIVDGRITDESIEAIEILYKPKEKGYILQNGLKMGQWLEIHFGGDEPAIIIGQITNIEDDMMELSVYPDSEKIYIDFGYQGIPLNLPIIKINIRDAPIRLGEDTEIKETSDTLREEGEITKEDDKDDDTKFLVDTTKNVEAVEIELGGDVLADGKIVFGDMLEGVTEVVAVSEKEQRFSIEEQGNDLLDEMLSTIPDTQRTSRVINQINTMINRFIQLRKEFSILDKGGNVEAIVKKGDDYKPLVETMYNLDKNLYWMIPIVKNKYKLYIGDGDDTAEDYDNDKTILINMKDSLLKLSNIEEHYRNNSLISDVTNRYVDYVKKVNPEYTPFVLPDNELELLTVTKVKENIQTIVEDAAIISASIDKVAGETVINRRNKNKQFLTTKYNLGIEGLEVVDKVGSKIKTEVKNITSNDKAPVKSFVTLPTPFVNYSKVNLPGTTIYDRTNLNHTSIQYWNVLNKKASVVENVVENLEDEYTYSTETGRTFIDKIRKLTIDEELDDEEKYKKFLQIIVPRSSQFFNMMKQYIQDGTNLHKIMSFLEPFMIYKSDVSFKQYSEMADFIDKNVEMFKKRIAGGKQLAGLQNLKVKVQYFGSTLLRLIGFDESEIRTLYKIREYALPSESYIRMLTTDYGEYYNNLLSLQNKDLFSNINIEQTIKQTITNMEAVEMEKTEEEEQCKNYVLTKRYVDMEELEQDSGNPDVFFDKKYDDTPYDIIREYKTQQDAMEPSEFQVFLQQKLMENVGLNAEKALDDAMAMIEGKRRVKEGQYAVLDIGDYVNDEDTEIESIDGNSGDDMNSSDRTTNNQRLYYRRVGDNWRLDESISSDTATNDTKMFCNVRNSCIQIKNDCESIPETKDKLVRDAMEKLLTSMEEDYEKNRDTIVRDINKRVVTLKERVGKLVELNYKKMLNDNNKLHQLGLKLEETDIIVSPYEELRDRILGEQDMNTKHRYLLKFIEQFTRRAVPDSEESDKWFYCTQTNVKLLPTFFYDLAVAGEYQYLNVLEQICKERGTISDDGNMWVDKHSGYTIRVIDFETEFGDEGVPVVRTELMVEDFEVEDITLPHGVESKKERLFNTLEARISRQVLNALSTSLGINMDEHRDFIIRESIGNVMKALPPMEKFSTKGKYNTEKVRLIVFFTALFLLITIQTSVPGLKTKKTVPGCVTSLSGYPYDNSNFGGIEYISCIISKISKDSDSVPWSTLKRKSKNDGKIKSFSTDDIKKRLIHFYDNYLKNDSVVRLRINEKQKYVLAGGDETEITPDINVTKWTTFLPPLKETKHGRVDTVSSTFKSGLNDDLKSSKSDQFIKLSTVRGKLIAFSMKIIEEIQEIVKLEPALLETMGGEPFLQNVCCNPEKSIKALHFFIEKRPAIKEHNEALYKLTDLYNTVLDLTKAPFLMSTKNTKVKYPVLKKDFNEETIYKAFIEYCNYNKDMPLKENLRILCSDNRSEFGKLDSIEEKIRVLKNEGRIYTQDALEQLLKIVAKENYIYIDLNKRVTTTQMVLSYLLNNIPSINNSISEAFKTEILKMLDAFGDVKELCNERIKDLRNFLISETESIKEELKPFIRQSQQDVLDTIADFNIIQDSNDFLNDREATILHMYKFIKNMTHNVLKTYPNMVINEVNYEAIRIPDHWKLSQTHSKQIKNFVNKSHSILSTLYGNDTIHDLMKVVEADNTHLLSLIKQDWFSLTNACRGETNMRIFELSKDLITYVFFVSLHTYVKAMDDPRVLSALGEEGEIEGLDVLEGNRELIRKTVSKILSTYMSIFQNIKKEINMNKDMILNEVTKIKENEKDEMTSRLGALTDELRKVDQALRKAKLGKWGIAMQKGLTMYDPKFFDAEMEELALKQQRDAEIDAEAYSMAGLPNDEDYGDRDGDEHYY